MISICLTKTEIRRFKSLEGIPHLSNQNLKRRRKCPHEIKPSSMKTRSKTEMNEAWKENKTTRLLES